MRYDPERHNRQSIRLPDYDYSQPGWYYVTIVCQEHACLLDPQPVRDMIMQWWRALPEKFGNVRIDQFVIMPNHIHGIIEIAPDPTVGASPRVRPDTTSDFVQETDATARPTLGRIIQWFKTMTTNAYIRGVKDDGWEPFPRRVWQRNYYERIIRNERELNAIRQYILDNPDQWDVDRENPSVVQRRTSQHSPR